MSYASRLMALGGLLLATGTGCGGIGAGDYLVYRIAFQETEMGSDCYAGAQIPPDEQDDSSSVYQSGTFILYATDDETFYLDTGTITLEGKAKGDDEYEFEGVITDVSWSGPGDDSRETVTQSTNVTFLIDGEAVEGEVVERDAWECEGVGCPLPSSGSCTETTPFVGSEVDDVDLKHEV